MKKLILSLIVLSIISISCKSVKDKSDNNKRTSKNVKMQKIETGTFSIIEIDGLNEITKKPVLKLDFVNNKISGNSACNLYGGSFTHKESRIKFNALMSTRRYCKDFAKIEIQYLKMLSTVTKYKLKDSKIMLYNNSDKVVIIGELVK